MGDRTKLPEPEAAPRPVAGGYPEPAQLHHPKVDVSVLSQKAAPFVAPKINLLLDWRKRLPPEPPPAPAKKIVKTPEMIAVSRENARKLILLGIGLTALIATLGGGVYLWRRQPAVSTPSLAVSITPSSTASPTPTPDPGRTVTSDGKKLDPTTNKLGAGAYDNNKNIGYRDTGGDDSIQEYEDLLIIKKVGDAYINALGSRNNTAAWDLLSRTEQTYRPQSARYADWYAEYLAAPFTTTSTQSAGKQIAWGSDQCLEKYDAGWAKTITSAYYYTPSFQLISGVTTQIQLVLRRESGTWKIEGENNLLINSAAIKRGDAYAKIQAARIFLDPKKCEK